MRAALALVVVAACTSGTSKQDASKLYSATSQAITGAQAKAVASTTGINIDFNGPCESEGGYHVKGLEDMMAGTFDLQVTFTDCVDANRVALDGDVHYASTTTSGTLTGSMSFSDRTTSAMCDLDLHFALSGGMTFYAGTVCGYDIGTF
jgi:hypothetical protein